MKKVIITRNQLKMINENMVNITAKAGGNSTSDFINTVGNVETQKDIDKAGRVSDDVNLTISGPESNDTQPVQTVNVAPGETAQSAIQNQANDDLIRAGGKVEVTGDGFGESKIFTKKMVEEARIDSMRKTGKVMTKKELKNSVK
jgi:hypothetical protein